MPQDNVLAIGRADYCDFLIPEVMDKVSRLHCYIEKCDDGTYCLHDVSKNGTKIQPRPQSQTFREKLRQMFAAF